MPSINLSANEGRHNSRTETQELIACVHAGKASPWSKSGAMKNLYVNPRHDPGSATEFLKRAVLIAGTVEDSAAFEFEAKLKHQQFSLLAMYVWDSELAETVELLESMEKGADSPE